MVFRARGPTVKGVIHLHPLQSQMRLASQGQPCAATIKQKSCAQQPLSMPKITLRVHGQIRKRFVPLWNSEVNPNSNTTQTSRGLKTRPKPRHLSVPRLTQSFSKRAMNVFPPNFSGTEKRVLARKQRRQF
jgi:hypothetical protein